MTDKPLICTFYELARALEPLHQNDRALLASLHDVWKLGAPSPGSIVRDPHHLDERQPMRVRGVNFIERLVLPGPLAVWIREASARRGIRLKSWESLNVALGRVNYEIPQGLKVTR